MHHVSLDIETMGPTPGSAILSIGAYTFNPWSDAPMNNWNFYVEINLKSCTDVGLTIDPDTVSWWMQQPDDARKVFENQSNPYLKSALPQALLSLNECLHQFPDARIWCHGASFDPGILEAGYRACGMKPVWKYTNLRDTRTIFELAGLDYKTFPRTGPEHSAYADAVTQAKALIHAHSFIKILPKPETGDLAP